MRIIKADITTLKVDAIVNSASSSLSRFREWAGVDGAIHRAAGSRLIEDLIKLGQIRHTGEVRITRGYNLPVKYIIHVFGPIWYGGNCGENEFLRERYKIALRIAEDKHCETIAFPLISAGGHGYPKIEALKVAVDALSNQQFLKVTLALFTDELMSLAGELYPELVS